MEPLKYMAIVGGILATMVLIHDYVKRHPHLIPKDDKDDNSGVSDAK